MGTQGRMGMQRQWVLTIEGGGFCIWDVRNPAHCDLVRMEPYSQIWGSGGLQGPFFEAVTADEFNDQVVSWSETDMGCAM